MYSRWPEKNLRRNESDRNRTVILAKDDGAKGTGQIDMFPRASKFKVHRPYKEVIS